MYYEEKIIDGQTFFRTRPDGNWSAVSNKELTKRIEELTLELRATQSAIEYDEETH